MRKYELTDEIKMLYDGTVLHRIRAMRDFTLSDGMDVKAGNLGGWVESEINLSQDGSAWVCGKAMVYGNARVYGNALVYRNARIFGDASVYGNARVHGDARVVEGASIYGFTDVFDDARVFGDASVYGFTVVFDDAAVYGNARVYGDASVHGFTEVYDSAVVYGDARVHGNAQICGNAIVNYESDYSVYKNTWSSERWFTYTRSNRMWKVGCFHGTGEALIAKAYRDSNMSGQCYEAIVRAQETIDKAKAHSNNHGDKEG